MKQITSLMLFIILTAFSINGQAQNDSCSASQSLTFPTSSNFSGSSSTGEFWYAIGLSADNYQVQLANLDASPSIYKMAIYDGSCGTLNFITADSLNYTGDSLLYATFTNTLGTNIYYIRLFTNASTSHYNLQISSVVSCTTCGTEMIPNGGFETFTSCGPLDPTVNPPLSIGCWTVNTHNPDLYARNCTNTINTVAASLGISTYSSNPIFNNHPGLPTPNNAVIGMGGSFGGFSCTSNFQSESIRTSGLTSPMTSGTNYTLRFWAYQYQGTLIDGFNGGGWFSGVSPCQTIAPAVISIVTSTNGAPNTSTCQTFPTGPNSILLANFTLAPVYNGWNYYTLNFTYPNIAPSQTFAIGVNGVLSKLNADPNGTIITNGYYDTYVLLDDLSMQTTSTAVSLNIPGPPNCSNGAITNLSQYVSPATSGVFTGTGVTGTYDFNINQNLPPGTYPVTFSYTTGTGCPMQVTQILTITAMPQLTVTGNPICNGGTATLNASGSTTGYTWNPGGLTGASVAVSPTATTVYTVTGTGGVAPNDCVITQFFVLTVNPQPNVAISPGGTSTICPGASIMFTASGAATYTWSPGNLTGSVVVVSPSVNTTYTVVGTSTAGCTNSFTAGVVIDIPPTILCNTIAPSCPGATAVLTASGGSTYTWNPGGLSGATVVVSPTVTTAYTVTGASALGCTNVCSVTQSVYPVPNTFSVTASPSVVCVAPPSTTQLNVLGAGNNYTWIPSGVIGVPITTNSPGSYSAAITNTVTGCTYTLAVSVGSTDANPSLTPPSSICSTNTIDLSLYSIPPGGTYSVDGVAVPSSTVGPLSAGIHTVIYTYTAGILCSNTATGYLNVLTPPSPITLSAVITPSVGFQACNGSIVTVTAFPQPSNNGYTYTWQPSGFVGNPLTYTPNASQIVTVICGPPGCTVTSTVSIDYNPQPCFCISNCAAMLSGTLVSDPPQLTSYCVNGDIYITGNITFFKSDFKMYPNVSIYVTPGSTLNIVGSHLFACSDLWNGIIVQNNTFTGQYGVLNITPGGKGTQWTPFIEDAKVAVDIQNWAIPGTNAPSILTAQTVLFNHNLISIRMNGYAQNQSPYPFSISNCLFTSRSVSFAPLSWPNTLAVKNSTNVGGTVMQTPYINNAQFPPSGITFTASTFYNQFPTNGIVMTNIGLTTVSVFPSYQEISIGQSGVSNFNCFDNLKEDITATNSNLTIINSVFQNGIRFGKGNAAGGKAINALSTSGSDGAFNNRIQIISVGQGTYNCRFYEKTACADITGYLATVIKYAECYSALNGYSQFTTPNVYGNRGFNVQTNRFDRIVMDNNKLFNIKNAMMIGLFNGYFSVGNQSGFSRFVGFIEAQNNYVDRHVNTPTGQEYVNIGLSVADVVSSGTVAYSPGAVYTDISSNTFKRVHNAVDVKNVSYAQVGIASNTVTMINEPNTFNPQPSQYGISSQNCLDHIRIVLNNVSGPVSYSSGLVSIGTSMNGSLSVRCNTTATTMRGIEFKGTQTTDFFEDNYMSSQNLGMVLDQNAVLSGLTATIGTATRPTDNIWPGTWTSPKFKTWTTGGSTAQQSKLRVRYNYSLTPVDPDGSGGNFGGVIPGDNYYHSPNTGTITLLNSTAVLTPTCRISLGGGGGGNGGAQALLQQAVADSLIYPVDSVQATSINKHYSYRTLKVNPSLMSGSSVLTTFFANTQTTNIGGFWDIENNLSNGSLNTAQSLISAVTPSDNIEGNYKRYYQIYKSVLDSSYSSQDSLDLGTLANKCPFTDGAVVYQARALYNIYYNGYYVFLDNCGGGNNDSRFMSPKPPVIEQKSILVQLRSSLYPNPNDGNYVLKLNGSVKKAESVEISIFDITGREVIKESRLLQNGEEVRMNTGLMKGTYLVKVKYEDGKNDIHRLIIDK